MSRTDRAVGAVLGSAAGDALGAPHEFLPPLPATAPLGMTGGGHFDWAPGEWTDDTSMAIPLLQALAEGRSLLEAATLDRVVTQWRDWARTATDVGAQTRSVFADMTESSADAAVSASARHLQRTGRAAGNGSLMRTGPVALGSLNGSDEHAFHAAVAQSRLTHAEQDALDGPGLWTVAIRAAIVDGVLDLRRGLPLTAEPHRWEALIDEAEQREPVEFRSNGWVVHALQAAWSAIHRTERSGGGLADALDRAVRVGDDTDTVAAIAGSLAGAYWGAAALPGEWRAPLHGWPGVTGDELERLALLAVA